MIAQSMKMAWKSISSNKMRFFLTMLGIIIGVISLVVLVSLVSGTTESVSSQISSMGNNLLTEAMMERFSQDEDAFTIVNQSTIMEAMESVNNTLALLLGGIAAISLVVGGIGIMNIMLVSVTERTREIGIRKAIGADRGTIMLQFPIEALMLSLLGCVIGILLSWGILQIISAAGDSDAVYKLSVSVVWISIAFSMGIRGYLKFIRQIKRPRNGRLML